MVASFERNTGSGGGALLGRRSVLALLGATLLPSLARAAPYPSRPIKIIVPFGPGGSGDITARLIGKQIEERTKQAVVIDNRPGANGIIGTMAVKIAEPDGHTVLLITTSTHAANVSLVRNLSYDPAADFTVVGVFRSSGSYLMVRPQAPWRDLAGFIAAAKAEPGKLTFGYFNASSRTPPEYLGKLAGHRTAGRALSRDRQCGGGSDQRRDQLPVHGYDRLQPISAERPAPSAGDHAVDARAPRRPTCRQLRKPFRVLSSPAFSAWRCRRRRRAISSSS